MPGPSQQDGPVCPVRWSGRQAAAVLPGQLDVTNVAPVREQLLTVINRGAAVLILDMSPTASCDYAGADALARICQRAMASATELRLVITAPIVRRVIEVCGLDRLIPVFPTLEAAQAASLLAEVRPLARRPASLQPAPLAPLGGPRRVSHLPGTSPGNRAPAEQPGPPASEAATVADRITSGIFRAGLVLQTALDQPTAALRQAVEHALAQLDDTVRDARTTAFGWHDQGDRGQAAFGAPTLPPRSGPPWSEPAWSEPAWSEEQAETGSVTPAGECAGRRTTLVSTKVTRTRERARQLHGRTLEVAVLAAATQDRVAVNLSQAAAVHPRRSADFQTLSLAATGRATQMRQWAEDHAAPDGNPDGNTVAAGPRH